MSILFSPQRKVSLQNFNDRNRHKSAIVWLTGLSGSGKSSIAIEIHHKLFKCGYNSFVLDGDLLRLGLNSDLSFSVPDRKENIRRAAQVANLFFDAGFIVLCSFISPFEEDRKTAREVTPANGFFEIYVQCSIEECISRDPKNLYKRAMNGEIESFTGISSPYEVPKEPDLIINSEYQSVESSSNIIISLLKDKRIIN